MEQLDTNELKTDDLFVFDEEVQPLYEVSKTKRFLHYIIDLMAFYAFGVALGIVASIAGGVEIIESANETLLGLVIMFTYYFTLESIFGQTIGKMITGSVVVTADGEKPSVMDIFKRTLSRLIPFDALSFLGSSIGWHDSFSKTRVVKK